MNHRDLFWPATSFIGVKKHIKFLFIHCCDWLTTVHCWLLDDCSARLYWCSDCSENQRPLKLELEVQETRDVEFVLELLFSEQCWVALRLESRLCGSTLTASRVQRDVHGASLTLLLSLSHIHTFTHLSTSVAPLGGVSWERVKERERERKRERH